MVVGRWAEFIFILSRLSRTREALSVARASDELKTMMLTSFKIREKVTAIRVTLNLKSSLQVAVLVT